mmetsp:Transcript_3456/g.7819  ORF Transcript_3456/g.7819 Transcript_3456/m.7819 type:complete len:263 (+) Transcript_3456:1125-1913(+)
MNQQPPDTRRLTHVLRSCSNSQAVTTPPPPPPQLPPPPPPSKPLSLQLSLSLPLPLLGMEPLKEPSPTVVCMEEMGCIGERVLVVGSVGMGGESPLSRESGTKFLLKLGICLLDIGDCTGDCNSFSLFLMRVSTTLQTTTKAAGTAPRPSSSLQRVSLDISATDMISASSQGVMLPGTCQKKAHAAACMSTLPSTPPSSAAFVADNGYTPPTPMPSKKRVAMMVMYTEEAEPVGAAAESMAATLTRPRVMVIAWSLPMRSPR